MEVSCGLVILNDLGDVFLAHVTGAEHWNIPKGLPVGDEQPLDTVLRETFEETSLRFRGEDLLDLGVQTYRPGKNLHLFAIKVPKASIEPSRCECLSFFWHEASSRELPEVDRFIWQPLERVSELCLPRAAGVLARVEVARLAVELPLKMPL